MPICSTRNAWLVVALASALASRATASTATTPNLLVNGDAEMQRCTNDWTADSSVPGWRVTRGSASVLCYSAFAFAHETPVTPPDALPGGALFAAPGADTSMEQRVDVSAADAAIDSGGVQFNLSGWLGGWRDRPERATLTAIFLDKVGRATGSPVVIGDVDAQARGNRTGMVEREAHGLVPRGTRQINVVVQFVSGMTSFNNAYADTLSLTLSGHVSGLGPAATVPPAASIPPLDHVYVLMMENTNYADVFHAAGATLTVDSNMPFVGSLAARGVMLANAWGTYHPSDQNYVAMVAGDTFKYGPVYYPHYHLPVTHLGDLLDAKGKSWGGYVQHMKTPCNLASTGKGRASYSPDDQPFMQFANVIDNPARCVAHNRGLKDFESAIASDALPAFAWLAADNWWDGEGAWFVNYDVAFSNASQDRFLESTIGPLVESAAWRRSRSLLIVTWDESDGWGWPDNHIPALLVGSPGLLQAGSVIYDHVDGYDLLRTVESALGVGSLDRFDRFAQPLNAAFSGRDWRQSRAAGELWPTEAVVTRGSIADTFGRTGTPAAVDQGQTLTLLVPAGAGDDARVDLEPLGQVPSAASHSWRFNGDKTVSIPTGQLEPGVYGAWLRHGSELPSLAPMLVTILPPPLVSPSGPGVEIVGASTAGANPADLGLRYGSNPIVRYCRPQGAAPADSWIGIFPTGTPANQMTKAKALAIGFWLKTPGGGGENPPCGEAEAYASELTPGQDYQVLLFKDANGVSTAIGHTAAFHVIPALPQ